MTLAGTRPPTVDEWDKYELHHRARLATKPGLTGMWQVSGRSNITDLKAFRAIAYLSAMQYYFKPIQELPTGRGFADFVFLPKPEYRNYYPALVVELKWNKSAKSALQQIKDRKYPASIEQYTGDILLVGINYDKKTKKHECVIEQYEK